MATYRQHLRTEGVVRSVGILMGGTAAGQLILLLALPILTRVYDPADFNLLAVYVSCVGIGSVAACLRLDIAIPLPESDDDAADLLVLALLGAATTATVVGVVAFAAPQLIADSIDQPDIAHYLWLLPFGIFLASAYSAVQYWSTRQRQFKAIARTRLTQAVGGAGTQVAGAAWHHAPVGLLLGHAISGGAGVLSLGVRAYRRDGVLFKGVGFASMRRTLREYRRFPSYSAPEALINTLGTQAPVVIIAAVAIGPEAGFLMLALRIMQGPVVLLGGAVAQVYLSEAAEHLRKGSLAPFTTRIVAGLAATGVGPLVFLGLAAPPTFDLVFGSEWERAGNIVLLMTPWIVIQFLSSPVSMVMHVRQRQPAMLALTSGGLALRVSAIICAASWQPTLVTEYFIAASAGFYSICTIVFFATAGMRLHDLWVIVRRSAAPIGAWIATALIFHITIGFLH